MVLSVRLSQSWALCVWVLVVVVSTVEGEGSVDCSRWANTMVYKEECHKDIVSEEEVLPLLVTGSGGCGTHTTTILLQKTGLDVKHEDFGQDGAVSWMYAVDARVQCVQTECNGYPWGPPVMTKRFRRVLHQVRCPVSNIAALLTHSPRSMIFMSPLVKTASQRLEYLGEVERYNRPSSQTHLDPPRPPPSPPSPPSRSPRVWSRLLPTITVMNRSLSTWLKLCHPYPSIDPLVRILLGTVTWRVLPIFVSRSRPLMQQISASVPVSIPLDVFHSNCAKQ